MATQSVSSKTYTLADASAARWFPAKSANLTGTLSSEGTRVTGTGTLFRSELNEDDYIVNSGNIARKILRILSDTDLILESSFPVALSGDTCNRLRNNLIRRLEVEFITNAGAIRNADQDTDGAWAAGAPSWESSGSIDAYTVPVFVTPGSGGARVIEVI